MIEQKCTFIHIRRDGNHYVDLLEKQGGNQLEKDNALKEPFAILISHMLRDNVVAYVMIFVTIFYVMDNDFLNCI